MPKFNLATIERWEHRVTYNSVEADTLEDALSRIKSGELAYDDQEVIECGDNVLCIAAADRDGQEQKVPPELGIESISGPTDKNSIWIVVRGEQYVPEAFFTQKEAEDYAAGPQDGENEEYVSGPWQVVLPPARPQLTERERSTVLAALRLWQRTEVTDVDLLLIACDGREDFLCGLAVEEIDELCERLNCAAGK